MSANETNAYGQPAWIIEPLSPYQIASILHGEREERSLRRDHVPLSGGSYMPAVEYSTASETMEKYGDSVLDYLHEKGCLTNPDMTRYAWCQIPCYFLSRAIVAWCKDHAHLADWEDQDPANVTMPV